MAVIMHVFGINRQTVNEVNPPAQHVKPELSSNVVSLSHGVCVKLMNQMSPQMCSSKTFCLSK